MHGCGHCSCTIPRCQPLHLPMVRQRCHACGFQRRIPAAFMTTSHIVPACPTLVRCTSSPAREQGVFTLPALPTLVYDKMCSFLSTLPHLLLVWVTTKWLSIIMKIREQFTPLLVPSPATPVPASAQVPAPTPISAPVSAEMLAAARCVCPPLPLIPTPGNLNHPMSYCCADPVLLY